MTIPLVITKRYTKVNWSHYDDSSLLKPSEIQIVLVHHPRTSVFPYECFIHSFNVIHTTYQVVDFHCHFLTLPCLSFLIVLLLLFYLLPGAVPLSTTSTPRRRSSSANAPTPRPRMSMMPWPPLGNGELTFEVFVRLHFLDKQVANSMTVWKA